MSERIPSRPYRWQPMCWSPGPVPTRGWVHELPELSEIPTPRSPAAPLATAEGEASPTAAVSAPAPVGDHTAEEAAQVAQVGDGEIPAQSEGLSPSEVEDAASRQAGARTGCHDRFAEVYAAYWPHTVWFIARQLRRADRGAVEDLAQTTFLRAWPYLDKVEVCADGAMYRWLSTIARHVVCDHYNRDHRRRGSRPRVTETPVAPDSPLWQSARLASDPAAGTAAVDERIDLHAGLQALPAQTRQAIEQRIVDGQPWSVVAQQMHHGKATIRRLVDEGLDTLRAALADGSGMEAPAHGQGRGLTYERPLNTSEPTVHTPRAITALPRVDRSPGPQPTQARDRTDTPIVTETTPAPIGDAAPAQDAPSATAGADRAVGAVHRAQRALVQIDQHRAGADARAPDQAQAEQLARWHAEDRAAAPHEHAPGRDVSGLAVGVDR